MRKIVIRIDDVTENMDWIKFRKFEGLLDQYGICPLIGVIPCNCDRSLMTGQKIEDYAGWLKEKQKQGWVIAMHGHDHVYVTKKGGMFPLNRYSEFAGLPLAEQVNKLREGIRAMRELNLSPDIFMAPAHSFDQNTVKALKMCGFHYITDGFGSTPYIRNKMTYLPIALQKNRELKKKDGISTFVVHTATMTEEEFGFYERLLINWREQFADYGEMLRASTIKQNRLAQIQEYCLAAAKELVCRIRNRQGL